MTDKKEDEQEKIDENIELSYQEKLIGQLECLKEMNKILNGALERHEIFKANRK